MNARAFIVAVIGTIIIFAIMILSGFAMHGDP